MYEKKLMLYTCSRPMYFTTNYTDTYKNFRIGRYHYVFGKLRLCLEFDNNRPEEIGVRVCLSIV